MSEQKFEHNADNVIRSLTQQVGNLSLSVAKCDDIIEQQNDKIVELSEEVERLTDELKASMDEEGEDEAIS